MATSTSLNATPLVKQNPAFPRAALLWFGALLLALYLPVLIPMVREWYTEDEMGHGFFVPPVVAYLIWSGRRELLETPVKPIWWPIGLILWGFVQSLLGYLGAEFFIARTGFLIALCGTVWALCGTAVMKRLAFPLVLCAFAIRIPQFIYGQITLPLQKFASAVAEHTLFSIGIPVLRDGIVLELAEHRLSVVEACSGIRSLLSLGFLSLVYGYLFETRTWMRVTLCLLTVPIAILSNAGRVTITGILYAYLPQYAEGVYHSLEGWVVFLIAMVALMAIHRVLNRMTRMLDGRR
jgi:exosortase